jgi:succinoglycan biosynthesis transport protein ExoP
VPLGRTWESEFFRRRESEAVAKSAQRSIRLGHQVLLSRDSSGIDKMISEPEPNDDSSRSWEWFLGIAIRRRWLILGSVFSITLGTVLISFRIPNRFTSEATIFAVQQRVPERYVVPTTNSDPSQALEAMVQEVLSRPRLLGVIHELALYTERKKELEPDELIQLVRKDLTVEPVERMLGSGSVNAFKVSFIADTPEMARAVTDRLTTLFIQQNLKARADQAATTTEFLHEQLEVARRDLQVKEQHLRDFKMQYLGELPEQQQGNLGILAGVQSQLDNVMASQNQAKQQRLYLE